VVDFFSCMTIHLPPGYILHADTSYDLLIRGTRGENSDMRRLTLLAIAAVSLGLEAATSALAADVSVKAPPNPIASTWAGSYIGFAFGAKWADAKWTTTQFVEPPSPDVGTAVIDASSPDRFHPLNSRLGGYAGFNWQLDRWVYGFEFDAAWSDASDTHAGIPGCKVICFVDAPGPGVDSSSIRLLWDASLRARVGYLVTPDTLIYGTGGVTWQGMEVSGTCANTSTDPVCLVSPPFAIKTHVDRYTLIGWTLGGGVERKIGAWLLRGEYRYSNLGTVQGVLFPGQPVADPGSDAVHYSISIRTHVATLGIAHKF
jgi:outer membrane immunogenic protein